MIAIRANDTSIATLDKITQAMVDVYAPVAVEISICGRAIWVNVNGICLLRIQDAQLIRVEQDIK